LARRAWFGQIADTPAVRRKSAYHARRARTVITFTPAVRIVVHVARRALLRALTRAVNRVPYPAIFTWAHNTFTLAVRAGLEALSAFIGARRRRISRIHGAANAIRKLRYLASIAFHA
jgi:hypothetical protein